MVAAFGWSAGDLMNSVQVLYTVAQAFDDARGAKAQYKPIKAWLDSFADVLKMASDALEAQTPTPEREHIMTALQAMDKPYRDFEEFLRKYENFSTMSGKSVRKVKLTIEWAIQEGVRGKVDKLRKEVNSPLQTITLALQLYQAKSVSTSSKQIQDRLSEIEKLLKSNELDMQSVKDQNEVSTNRILDTVQMHGATTNARLDQLQASDVSANNKVDQMLSLLQGMNNLQTQQAPLKRNPRPSKIDMRPPVVDKNFIDRDGIIESMAEMFQESQRVALVGLSGVGKSRLAREYASSCLKEDPFLSILLVRGECQETFLSSYRSIANEYGDAFPYIDEQNADFYEEVKGFLSSEESGPWLLIVDNVDEPEVYGNALPANITTKTQSQGQKTLLDYLPLANVGHGRLLITSRSTVAAQWICGSDCVDVEPMQPDDAVELLRKKLRHDKSPREDLLALVEELGYLPLAIVQASAYMWAHRKMKVTVTSYLEKYRTSELQLHQLFAVVPDNRKGELKQNSSVFGTLNTTLEYLDAFDPNDAERLAVDLLAAMSFYHFQAIPDALIKSLFPQASEKVERAMEILAQFCLIASGTIEKSQIWQIYDIHRLTQLATRLYLMKSEAGTTKLLLSERGQLLRYRSLLVLDHSVATAADTSNFEAFDILMTHASEACHVHLSPEKDVVIQAGILMKIGQHLYSTGELGRASQYLQESIKLFEKELDAGRRRQYLMPDYLITLTALAGPLMDSGRVYDANLVHEKLNTLVKEHPEYPAWIRLRLEISLCTQLVISGELKAAEMKFKKVLSTTERMLKSCSDDEESKLMLVVTAGLWLSLAQLYTKEGRGFESESCFPKISAICKRIVVRPEEQSALNDFRGNVMLLHGDKLLKVGKTFDAEIILSSAYKEVFARFPKEHPKSIGLSLNLSFARYRLKFKSAEQHLQDLLTLREEVIASKTLAQSHPQRLLLTFELAFQLFNSGNDYYTVHKLNQEVIAGYTNISNDAKFDLIGPLMLRAVVLAHLDQLEEAITTLLEVYKIQQFYMDESPIGNTGVYYQSQTSVLESGDRLHLELTNLTYQRAKELFGANHLTTLHALDQMASAQWACQLRFEAVSNMKDVLEQYNTILESQHFRICIVQQKLARYYLGVEDYASAEALWMPLHGKMVDAFGWQDFEVLDISNRLAETLRLSRKFDLAEPLYKRTLENRIALLGPHSPRVFDDMNNLALLYQDQQKHRESELIIRDVVALRRQHQSIHHPDVYVSLDNLSVILMASGKRSQAMTAKLEVVNGRARVLGADHELTLLSISQLATSLSANGQKEMALEMHRRVYKARRDKFGATEPNTVNELGGLISSLEQSGKKDEIVKLLQEAVEDLEGAENIDHETKKRLLLEIGRGKTYTGDEIGGSEMLEKVVEMLLNETGKKPPSKNLTWHAMLRRCGIALSMAYRKLKKFVDMEKLGRKLLDVEATSIQAKALGQASFEKLVMEALNGQGKHRDAIPFAIAALTSRRDFEIRTPSLIGPQLGSLAETCFSCKEIPDDAKTCMLHWVSVLGQSSDLHACQGILKVAHLMKIHELPEAERVYVTGIELCKEVYPPSSTEPLKTELNLVEFLAGSCGRRAEALDKLHKVYEDYRERFLENNEIILRCRYDILYISATTGELDEDHDVQMRELCAIAAGKFGELHADTLLWQSSLGYILMLMGKVSESVAVLEETVEKCRKANEKDWELLAGSRELLAGTRLAESLFKAGDTEAALDRIRSAHAGYVASEDFGPEKPVTWRCECLLLKLESFSQGNYEKAIARLEEIVAKQEERPHPNLPVVMKSKVELGRMHLGLGDSSTARKIAMEAITTLTEAGIPRCPEAMDAVELLQDIDNQGSASE